MAVAQEKAPERICAEDYLALEAQAETKSEYVDGLIYAMVGASSAHNLVCGNLYLALRALLKSKPCQVFNNDMKLRVAEDDAYYYPDLFVTCSEADRQSQYIKSEPILIIEVLSPSTALYDRDKKFASYRKLPSLQEYMLVDQERLAIECYRRASGGEWILHPYEKNGETVTLHSLELTFPLDDVYQDVDFPQSSEPIAQASAE